MSESIRTQPLERGAPTAGASDAKVYLDYLEKEMTIMGVLSAFAVSALAAVLWKVADVESNKASLLAQVWKTAPWLILIGAASHLLSALFFYRQRSRLAWYYGQIALATLKTNGRKDAVAKLLADADGWDTWEHYWWGFVFLTIGFVGYGIAFASGLLQPTAKIALLIVYGSCSLVALGLVARMTRIARDHPQEEEPFKLSRKFFGLH
jgi:hypothetical protein